MLRQPTVFVPHGGGPWPFVDLGMLDKKPSDDQMLTRQFLPVRP